MVLVRLLSQYEPKQVAFGKAMPLTSSEEKDAIALLKRSILLRECSEEQLSVSTQCYNLTFQLLSKQMEKKRYRKGDILVKEGEPQERMFVIAKGETFREKTIEGQVQQ
jgi:hypothetical protein